MFFTTKRIASPGPEELGGRHPGPTVRPYREELELIRNALKGTRSFQALGTSLEPVMGFYALATEAEWCG